MIKILAHIISMIYGFSFSMNWALNNHFLVKAKQPIKKKLSFRNKLGFGCSFITLLIILEGCSESPLKETGSPVEQNEKLTNGNIETITDISPDWSNPVLSPYGSSIGNIIRGYFLIGDFQRLRQHIIYPSCYSPEEIDFLLRTSEWGYDIKLTNLNWNADSTEFVITYKTLINETAGMDQYKGALVNDSAKLYFFPNTKTRFKFTGKDEFDELCILKDALSDVLFEVDKATILPSSKEALERIVQFFRLHDGEKAVITGHTSSEGDVQHNQKLSEKRAKAIYDYLKASGINVQQIGYRGKGSAEPIYPNDSEENSIKNRRVVIEFS
jgi:outer membrane protein OmpA-like peptidoglycan-associated protein